MYTRFTKSMKGKKKCLRESTETEEKAAGRQMHIRESWSKKEQAKSNGACFFFF